MCLKSIRNAFYLRPSPRFVVRTLALPKKWSEVERWARDEFEREIAGIDDHINLGRACLLIALEEEAAVEMHPEIEEVAKEYQIQIKSMASASTWSLERLNSLAEEVKAILLQEISHDETDMPVAPNQTELLGHHDLEGRLPDVFTVNDVRSSCTLDFDLSLQNPAHVLRAVNTVLFERHGYKACNRYGMPKDAQLSSVMEIGIGSSSALSILYMEVCNRLGLKMSARPLEEDRYFIVWPDQHISLDGERFVVDPYGCGELLLASEVCELFDVSYDQLLLPATKRQLLAALLGDLRDSHWAKAAGCSANPGSILPVSLETALQNKISNVHAHSIKRAISAASKRLKLMPEDSQCQLELGLLHYFAGSYDDAWLELGILLEQQLLKNPPRIPDIMADLGISNEQAALEDMPKDNVVEELFESTSRLIVDFGCHKAQESDEEIASVPPSPTETTDAPDITDVSGTLTIISNHPDHVSNMNTMKKSTLVKDDERRINILLEKIRLQLDYYNPR